MFKFNKSIQLKNTVINSLTNNTIDAASDMPDLTGKNVLIGFWHNWPAPDSIGYQGGHFKEMSLTEIPEDYNVVAVAFMKGSGIPTFKPYNMSDEEFRRQVGILNSQGRAVLISLGGADAHISLQTGQEEALAYEIIRLVETYGFDGLDIDLEQSAITEQDNQTVLPAALKLVKDHYKTKGKNFIISMAPEFPYLRDNGKYEPYITRLEGYYDFIAPQYYNQGGDGVWVGELDLWITQNNDEQKENFLYYLTDSIVNGTRGYIKIPHDKFVIGLPSNNDAAATGYVIDADSTLNALQRLKDDGQGIRGLMTWSVNWDAGTNKNGQPYNWEFVTRYGHISDTETNPTPNKPSIPTGLSSTKQTATSISLEWDASTGINPIHHYTIYRNGKIVASSIQTLTYLDENLAADTEYEYQVSATDNQGNVSSISSSIKVKTKTEPNVISEWAPKTWYEINDKVSYQGNTYICLAKHTSREEWTPSRATTLWKVLSTY